MTRELSVEKLHLGRAVSFNRFDIMEILKNGLAPNLSREMTFEKLYLGRAVSFNRCDVVPVDCAVLHTLKFAKVRSLVMAHSESSSELTFENFSVCCLMTVLFYTP